MAGKLQRAKASKQTDHASFLFKLLPPWLRVLTREVETASHEHLAVFTEGPLVRKEQVATKLSPLCKIPPKPLRSGANKDPGENQRHCCNFVTAV